MEFRNQNTGRTEKHNAYRMSGGPADGRRVWATLNQETVNAYELSVPGQLFVHEDDHPDLGTKYLYRRRRSGIHSEDIFVYCAMVHKGKTVKRWYAHPWVSIVIGYLILYVAMAFWVYRFRHPEQTETQLFQHFFDAILWR